MNFEQEVIYKLGQLAERSDAQTKLLEALNSDGCGKGHADRSRLDKLESDTAKLWKYSRAMVVPERRTKRWVAAGTAFGAGVATAGKLAWDWLNSKGG